MNKPKVVEYKNPYWVSGNRINCDILHPRLNEWMPYTCGESDPEALIDSDDLWSKLIADPNTIPYKEPTEEELLKAERTQMRCSKTQFVITLGKTKYNTLLAALTTDENWNTQVAFENSNMLYRNQELIRSIQKLLSLTDAAIDDIFRAAARVVE